MSTPSGAGFASTRVRSLPVYRSSGAFSPALSANVRAAAWLLARADAEVWHFVFAPNSSTSAAGRLLRAWRRTPTVQTVASRPRRFRRSHFFGDVVVAQSEWTRGQILAAFDGRRAPRIEVVPPPVGTLRQRTSEEVAFVRRALDIEGGRHVYVYPGDLEFSSGARIVSELVRPLVERVRDAVVVFACRAKTRAAPGIARQIAEQLAGLPVRFAPDGIDFLTLLSTATAVLFPVDDLFGKVDLPISLLEAMSLGVPVVTFDWGPLAELEGSLRVPRESPAALLDAAVAVAADQGVRARLVDSGRAAVDERYAAARVSARYEALYQALLDGS